MPSRTLVDSLDFTMCCTVAFAGMVALAMGGCAIGDVGDSAARRYAAESLIAISEALGILCSMAMLTAPESIKFCATQNLMRVACSAAAIALTASGYAKTWCLAALARCVIQMLSASRECAAAFLRYDRRRRAAPAGRPSPGYDGETFDPASFRISMPPLAFEWFAAFVWLSCALTVVATGARRKSLVTLSLAPLALVIHFAVSMAVRDPDREDSFRLLMRFLESARMTLHATLSACLLQFGYVHRYQRSREEFRRRRPRGWKRRTAISLACALVAIIQIGATFVAPLVGVCTRDSDYGCSVGPARLAAVMGISAAVCIAESMREAHG